MRCRSQDTCARVNTTSQSGHGMPRFVRARHAVPLRHPPRFWQEWALPSRTAPPSLFEKSGGCRGQLFERALLFLTTKRNTTAREFCPRPTFQINLGTHEPLLFLARRAAWRVCFSWVTFFLHKQKKVTCWRQPRHGG